MSNKKSKVPAYDENADYNYDIMPDGSRNPKRFNGYDRPPSAANDIFWWLSMFNHEDPLEKKSDPTSLN